MQWYYILYLNGKDDFRGMRVKMGIEIPEQENF